MSTDSAPSSAPEPSEYVKVFVKGKLNNQVVAIGGETTGTVITANGITWELELGDNAELRRKAEELHDHTVIISGMLRMKRGVEIPQRWIVTVSSLKQG